MKKKLMMLLAVLMVAVALVGCQKKEAAPTAAPEVVTDAPAETPAEETPAEEAPAEETTAPANAG